MHVEESNIKTIDIELIKLRSIYYISLLAMSLRFMLLIWDIHRTWYIHETI